MESYNVSNNVNRKLWEIFRYYLERGYYFKWSAINYLVVMWYKNISLFFALIKKYIFTNSAVHLD